MSSACGFEFSGQDQTEPRTVRFWRSCVFSTHEHYIFCVSLLIFTGFKLCKSRILNPKAALNLYTQFRYGETFDERSEGRRRKRVFERRKLNF